MLCCNTGAGRMVTAHAGEARSSMKWFRSNIKHGARAGLVALAIQFALSFGHFHGVVAQAAPAIAGVSAESLYIDAEYADPNRLGITDPVGQSAQGQQPPASDRDSDRQPGDPCAICAVIAMAQTVLFATPPLLLLPQAVEFLYLATDAEFIHLNSVSAAFQPRAPPIS